MEFRTLGRFRLKALEVSWQEGLGKHIPRPVTVTPTPKAAWGLHAHVHVWASDERAGGLLSHLSKSVNRTEFCQQTRAVEALQEDKGCRRWGPCLPQQHTGMEGLGVTEGVKSPSR